MALGTVSAILLYSPLDLRPVEAVEDASVRFLPALRLGTNNRLFFTMKWGKETWLTPGCFRPSITWTSHHAWVRLGSCSCVELNRPGLGCPSTSTWGNWENTSSDAMSSRGTSSAARSGSVAVGWVWRGPPISSLSTTGGPSWRQENRSQRRS